MRAKGFRGDVRGFSDGRCEGGARAGQIGIVARWSSSSGGIKYKVEEHRFVFCDGVAFHAVCAQPKTSAVATARRIKHGGWSAVATASSLQVCSSMLVDNLYLGGCESRLAQTRSKHPLEKGGALVDNPIPAFLRDQPQSPSTRMPTLIIATSRWGPTPRR